MALLACDAADANHGLLRTQLRSTSGMPMQRDKSPSSLGISTSTCARGGAFHTIEEPGRPAGTFLCGLALYPPSDMAEIARYMPLRFNQANAAVLDLTTL